MVGEADTEAQFQKVLGGIQIRVTRDMKSRLMAEFTEEEIKKALDSIGDLKAPSPDGWPLVF